jgi:hypothetical protein
VTLEDLVSDLCDGARVAEVPGGEDDSMAYITASAAETDREETLTTKTLERAGRSGESDGRRGRRHRQPEEIPELSVMASGCLGLISFPREPGRLSLERIEQLYPDLLPALRSHPGVGFMLVRSDQDGAVVLGRDGTNYLDQDRVEGEDPLEPFGPGAAKHVKRTDGFPNCADIMVNSTYWDDLDEVAAFEELVGSHGGMGGTQSYPFVLHPRDLKWPEEEVVGAEGVYHVFKGWQAGLGLAGADADPVQAPAAAGGVPSTDSAVDSPGSSTRTSVPGE